MSGTLTPALATPGPLEWMTAAIQARLQQAFPANLFGFAYMPAKADRAWFDKYLSRTPALALGWNGTQADSDEGRIFTGTAHWTLALITKNAGSVQARYVGDKLAPGLFAMARVATLMLHGFLIDPDGTPWTATGTIKVTAIGNLFNEEWGGEGTAIAALDLHVQYEEVPPPGLEQAASSGPLEMNIAWDFGEQTPLLTDSVGGL